MSSKDTFLLSNYDIGEKTDVKPFLLPEKAFEVVSDAYIFRGRVEKRFGFNIFPGTHLNTRLRINLGNTDGAGNIAGNVPGVVYKIGQMFSIGTEVFTVNAAGLPAVMLTTGAAAVHTYNTNTGAYVINGAAINTACYFYPAEPVMGLLTRELLTINMEETIAFDTQFSYYRFAGGWNRLDIAAIWTGTNYRFFSSTNWIGVTNYTKNLFVVNYTPTDNIKYLPQGAAAWTNLRPQLNGGATRHLETCRVIIVFKDRLLALNTIEDEAGTDRTYTNRVRWSQNGDPTVAATSWLDDVVGRGGYLDAPTSEAIIAAQFVKDRLIVFCERSTFELVYTGNEILPFRFQQINTELGCESTFSEVPFDDGIISVGNRGIHVANSAGVQRIDVDIPDEVFKINNLEFGHERVYGIRDYFREIVMWSYTFWVSLDDDMQGTPVFPNRVLVYNYRNNTFSFFNDRFTCYGYHQKSTGLTWATLPFETWEAWTVPWNSGTSQAQFPLIIAGNAQGWTFLFEETGTNDSSIYINDIVGNTIFAIDHGLQQGMYVIFSGIQGGVLPDQVYIIQTVPTNDRFTITETITGVYTGGGQIEVLNKFTLRTKNFNFYWNVEKSFEVDRIFYLLDRTENGEITVNYYIDGNPTEAIPPLWGDNIIYTRPEDNEIFTQNQEYIWHKDSRNIIAQSLQVELTLSEDQMKDLDIQSSNITLEAMLFKVAPVGRI